MRRRALLAGSVALLAGCAAPEDPSAKLWHGGQLTIGTGNTTGVFYQIGGGYADLVTRFVPGYDAAATPSGGSVDNLERLSTGDVQIALTLAGPAADGYAGNGIWAGKPQPFRALARAYDNVEHVIARVDSGVTSVAGMKGRKVSFGSPNSGSELIGHRLVKAAGLDPDHDLTALSMSLSESTAALLDGSIQALIWSGGLPTPGIADLFGKAGGAVRFVRIQDLRAKVADTYPALLTDTTIPKDVYGLAEDVPALADANLIVVNADLPVDLAYRLTRLLFEHQKELALVHPAAGQIRRDQAPLTDPVPLHPGAQRYYNGG